MLDGKDFEPGWKAVNLNGRITASEFGFLFGQPFRPVPAAFIRKWRLSMALSPVTARAGEWLFWKLLKVRCRRAGAV